MCSSDLFVVDGARQTLMGGIPNHFFGQVILVFEELMGVYFQSLTAAPEELPDGKLAK